MKDILSYGERVLIPQQHSIDDSRIKNPSEGTSYFICSLRIIDSLCFSIIRYKGVIVYARQHDKLE